MRCVISPAAAVLPLLHLHQKNGNLFFPLSWTDVSGNHSCRFGLCLSRYDRLPIRGLPEGEARKVLLFISSPLSEQVFFLFISRYRHSVWFNINSVHITAPHFILGRIINRSLTERQHMDEMCLA